MKNLAIIIQKLNGGGAERTASNLSLLLNSRYNIHLIVFDGTDISYPYEGKLHDLKLPPVKGKANKVINLYKRIAAVKKILKEEKIDCAISLMGGANLVNVLAKRRNKVITSVRIQMSGADRHDRNVAGLRKKNTMVFIGKGSDKIVALSKGVEKDLNQNFGIPQKKLVTIYNPCDYNKLREVTNQHNPKLELERGNALVTMGRLSQQKGQWHLIRALSVVKEQIPDVKLYVLGEGELHKPLERLIAKLNLQENVKLLGYVEAPHSCFDSCDCFVFPSLYEGLGNVLLEAMAFGVPCISADCPAGPREIIAPGTDMKEKFDEVEYAQYGILTSVCSGGNFNAVDPLSEGEKQLAEAIIAILTDEQLRNKYAQLSLQRIQDFAPEKIAEDWVKVIEA